MDAWLLQPGDPLPPLPTDAGVLTGQSWPGQWALLVLGPRDRLAEVQAPEGAQLVTMARESAHGDVWAQRLGAVVGDARVVLTVLVEPRGTVVEAGVR